MWSKSIESPRSASLYQFHRDYNNKRMDQMFIQRTFWYEQHSKWQGGILIKGCSVILGLAFGISFGGFGVVSVWFALLGL